MRFLADAGISPKTVEFLRRSGHDAIHVRELAMQRASDRVLSEQGAALQSGALILVEDTRYRVRSLPIRSE